MPKLPGIHHKDAIRVLEKCGWRAQREGKHTIMAKGTHANSGERARQAARQLERPQDQGVPPSHQADAATNGFTTRTSP